MVSVFASFNGVEVPGCPFEVAAPPDEENVVATTADRGRPTEDEEVGDSSSDLDEDLSMIEEVEEEEEEEGREQNLSKQHLSLLLERWN